MDELVRQVLGYIFERLALSLAGDNYCLAYGFGRLGVCAGAAE